MILEAGIRLVEQEGGEKLTMARLARELEVAPMSLYLHVESRDDLCSGIFTEMLGRFEFEPDTSAGWADEFRRWARAFCDHLAGYPRVTGMMGDSLEATRQLAGPGMARPILGLLAILADAGLAGEDLAWTMRWASRSTWSLSIAELADPDPQVVARFFSAVAERPPTEQTRFLELVPALAGIDRDGAVEFGIERILDGIRQVVREGRGHGTGGSGNTSG